MNYPLSMRASKFQTIEKRLFEPESDRQLKLEGLLKSAIKAQQRSGR
jgi:hypothetical protein